MSNTGNETLDPDSANRHASAGAMADAPSQSSYVSKAGGALSNEPTTLPERVIETKTTARHIHRHPKTLEEMCIRETFHALLYKINERSKNYLAQVKEITWPTDCMFPVGFSLLCFTAFLGTFMPSHFLLIFSFIISVALIITFTGKRVVLACCVALAIAGVTAAQIHLDPTRFDNQAEYWFVGRLIYVVGLTFWLPPLFNALLVFATERGRTYAIYFGCTALMTAFFLHYSNIKNAGAKNETPIGYTAQLLYDDALLGLVTALLFGALTASRLIRPVSAEDKE